MAITESSTGRPGCNGTIPFETGFFSEMLLPHGHDRVPATTEGSRGARAGGAASLAAPATRR